MSPGDNDMHDNEVKYLDDYRQIERERMDHEREMEETRVERRRTTLKWIGIGVVLVVAVVALVLAVDRRLENKEARTKRYYDAYQQCLRSDVDDADCMCLEDNDKCVFRKSGLALAACFEELPVETCRCLDKPSNCPVE